MSVGFTNPIGGSNVAFNYLAARPGNLGGAITGWMPKQTQLTDKRYEEFEQIRFTLRQGWNTTYPSQLAANRIKSPIITPFRAVMNAGDLLGRINYSCGGTCQTPQSRPNMNGLKTRFGAISKNCQPSVVYSGLQQNKDIPAAACNVKYVYDSSDYTTYLKQRAMVKNYNDYSFGGDDYNASQSAYRAIRRY
jgi:hypothetical protein